MADKDDSNHLFEANFKTIQRAIAHVCRRQSFYGDEADEFASVVYLRLLEGECAVLRKFQGKCHLAAYLSAVVMNVGRDYRIAKWKRWRNSAAAKRLGTLAVGLETLTVRDGYSLREAAEILRQHERVALSLTELAELKAQLPQRVMPRVDSSADLDDLPGSETAEEKLLRSDRERRQRELRATLDRALQILEPEDRLIMKMRFEEGLQVVAIARSLGLEPQPTYRRIQGNLQLLRSELEEGGRSAVAA